jgi:uncharacterized protein YndB with AHSA1/START domain
MAHEFIIRRIFDAPVELVWKAFTVPDHMKSWLGPKGTRPGHSEMDFRPGGTYHYSIISPDGNESWGKMAYREIEEPSRLVFVNSFSDEDGNITRHPMSETWPLEMLSTYKFEKHNTRTTVTIIWSPINASTEELMTFDRGHVSMRQGWTNSLDALETYLKEIQEDATEKISLARSADMLKA